MKPKFFKNQAAFAQETRERRLATLIQCSAKGEAVPPLTPRRPS